MSFRRVRYILPIAMLASQVIAVSQTFKVGIKAALSTIEPISTEAPYEKSTYPLDIGPVFEAEFPRFFAIEASALRKRVSYRQTVTSIAPAPDVSSETRTAETAARAWEVPIVFRKYIQVRPAIRPYGNLGFSIRRMSGTTHFESFRILRRPFPFPPGPPPAEFFSGEEEPSELIRTWSGGLVAGGGMEFKIGIVRLQPEIRYTRWANEPFRSVDANLRSARNSFDVLLGFSIGVK